MMLDFFANPILDLEWLAGGLIFLFIVGILGRLFLVENEKK